MKNRIKNKVINDNEIFGIFLPKSNSYNELTPNELFEKELLDD
jgi:hypothetical protein